MPPVRPVFAFLIVAVLAPTLCTTANAQGTKLDPVAKVTLERVMKRHPFKAFAALGRREHDETRGAWKGRRVDPPVQRALQSAALAGLWSKDPMVARGASSLLGESRLDVAAIERYQAIVAPMIFGRGDDADLEGILVQWDDFKHTVSIEGMTSLLGKRISEASEFRHFGIKDLHRNLRPEHVPALCKLTQDTDIQVRMQAYFSLQVIAQRTNRFRAEIATAFLQRPRNAAPPTAADSDGGVAYVKRALRIEPKTKGYEALLAAMLRRFVEEAPGSRRARTEIPWPWDWLQRWAMNSEPAIEDRDLLFALLESKHAYLRRIALRGLRSLRDKVSLVRLRKTAIAFDAAADAATDVNKGPDSVEVALCYAALVARGENDWRVKLQRASVIDDSMLAAALEVMPVLAVDDWANRALGRDSVHGRKAVKRMQGAEDAFHYDPFKIRSETRDAIASAIEMRCEKIDVGRLGTLIADLPRCRTAKVADAYLRKLEPADLPDGFLTFLEVADEKGLRAKLSGWLAESTKGADGTKGSGRGREAERTTIRDHTLDALMRLSAPELGTALVERWQKQKDLSLYVLARSGESEAVRGFLAKRIPKGEVAADKRVRERDWIVPLCALAMAHGLPERTCRAWDYRLMQLPISVLRERFKGWRRSVIAGQPVQALLGILDAHPKYLTSLPHLGLSKSPAVIARLRKLRTTPGVDVQWVIGELASVGDAAALAEMKLVRERAYYGWTDDLSTSALSEGFKLSLAPYWIAEIETNCCRRVAANQCLEEMLGYDVLSTGDGSLLTQHQAATRWFKRFAGQLKWSRMARRYVVGPSATKGR